MDVGVRLPEGMTMKGLTLAVPLSMLLLSGACISVHAHRGLGAADYRHHHRLDCDHVVACHFHNGRHHYDAHRSHARYTHMHHATGGRLVSCVVTRGRHSHR